MKHSNLISFIKGVGSVLDIYPSLPDNPVAGKSDGERLRSDWENVGMDINNAMCKVADEQEKKSG